MAGDLQGTTGGWQAYQFPGESELSGMLRSLLSPNPTHWFLTQISKGFPTQVHYIVCVGSPDAGICVSPPSSYMNRSPIQAPPQASEKVAHPLE